MWGIYARFLIQNVQRFITHSLTNSNTTAVAPLVALLHHHAKLQKSALRNLYTVLVFTMNIFISTVWSVNDGVARDPLHGGVLSKRPNQWYFQL